MKVQCLTCSRLEELPKTPQHAAVGMGRCQGDKPGRFLSIGTPRECGKYRAAPESMAGPRVIWFKKLGI